ncbi:MAG: S1 family peptidase, partial [Candidatus Saccharicenans sp.]
MEKNRFLLFMIAIFLIFSQEALSQSQEASNIMSKYSSGIITLTAWDGTKTVIGEGTGFAIDDNLVLVPYHLISQAVEAEISSIAGKKARVEAVVALHKAYDLALIRIKGKLDPIPLGKSESLTPDNRLYAMTEIAGRVVISEGTLRNWLELAPGKAKILDVSMSLEKPASGAPVFDDQGKVIGLA